MMVSRSISISVVCKKDNHYHHKRLPYSMKCQITIFFQQQNQVLKPTCISSRVLMAVRKCSLDLLQFTSFCKASELSVNWKFFQIIKNPFCKFSPMIIWNLSQWYTKLCVAKHNFKRLCSTAPWSSPRTTDFHNLVSNEQINVYLLTQLM